MDGKAIILSLIFLALLAGGALALEGNFLFGSLAYGRGWCPWIAMVDNDTSFLRDYFKLISCPDKTCPFEELAYLRRGSPCNSEGVAPMLIGAVRQITIPEDIKLAASDSFIVDDQVCPGETVNVSVGNRTGEWWGKGGVAGTPPIQWMQDVPSTVRKIVQYHKEKENEKIFESIIKPPQWTFADELGINVYVQTSMDVVVNTSPYNLSAEDMSAPSSGNIICSLRQKSAALFGAGSYAVENGADIEADVLCSYYIYGFYNIMGRILNRTSGQYYYPTGYDFFKVQIPTIINGKVEGYLDWMTPYPKAEDDLFRVGTIKFQKKLKVVQPTEAKLEIQSFAGPAEGGERLIRFVITNNGDGKASIDGIKIRGTDVRLTCDDKALEAGQSAECVAIVGRNDKSLRLAYSEEPCGKPKHNVLAVNLDIGAETGEEGTFCESSSDCSTGEECCASICRPAAEGVCDDIDSDGILDTWVPFE